MKNIMKVNNGGGISIERYDNEGNIVSVFTGMQFSGKSGNELLDDFVSYGTDWDWDDAGGQTTGYHSDGNTSGDLKMINNGDGTVSYGDELTAYDVIDNHESTEEIAVWDGETLEIDESGFVYFDISQD